MRPIGEGAPDRLGAGGAEMHVDEHGNGFVAVFSPDGGARASLGVAYPDLGNAGLLTVYGMVDNRERVVIGCNPETDSGSIKTYRISVSKPLNSFGGCRHRPIELDHGSMLKKI